MNRPVKKTTATVARILITDDDREQRWMLSAIVRNEGFTPLEAADGPSALRLIRQGLADVLLLDLAMPGMNGLELLREARQVDGDLPVILISGCGSSESAVEAGLYGAQSFFTKPIKNDELILTVRMALESRRRLQADHLSLDASLQETFGPSVAMQKVLSQIELVAPTDFTVIVSGETGVGKEVAARAIHRNSRRAAGPFVPVDCGSIPEALIESELFGHEKGAFTGADHVRRGAFEIASGGTVFLDEIGNLPFSMQAKLLRVLQEKQIHRVGGTASLRLDVRVLAATNEDLSAMVAAGRFRRDLFFRLNEFAIAIPPLRERIEDVPFLAGRFLELTGVELRKTKQEIAPEAMEMFQSHDWPGNVRELCNLIRRAALLADARIEPEHLQGAGLHVNKYHSGPAVHSFKEVVRRRVMETEREVLLEALREADGNMARAARALHIDYKTMRVKAKQHCLHCGNGQSSTFRDLA